MEIRIFDIDSHSESELKLYDAVKHYKSTLEALWTLAHQNFRNLLIKMSNVKVTFLC